MCLCKHIHVASKWKCDQSSKFYLIYKIIYNKRIYSFAGTAVQWFIIFTIRPTGRQRINLAWNKGTFVNLFYTFLCAEFISTCLRTLELWNGSVKMIVCILDVPFMYNCIFHLIRGLYTQHIFFLLTLCCYNSFCFFGSFACLS